MDLKPGISEVVLIDKIAWVDTDALWMTCKVSEYKNTSPFWFVVIIHRGVTKRDAHTVIPSGNCVDEERGDAPGSLKHASENKETRDFDVAMTEERGACLSETCKKLSAEMSLSWLWRSPEWSKRRQGSSWSIVECWCGDHKAWHPRCHNRRTKHDPPHSYTGQRTRTNSQMADLPLLDPMSPFSSDLLYAQLIIPFLGGRDATGPSLFRVSHTLTRPSRLPVHTSGGPGRNGKEGN